MIKVRAVWFGRRGTGLVRYGLHRALLEGEGGHRGSPRVVAERSQGM